MKKKDTKSSTFNFHTFLYLLNKCTLIATPFDSILRLRCPGTTTKKNCIPTIFAGELLIPYFYFQPIRLELSLLVTNQKLVTPSLCLSPRFQCDNVLHRCICYYKHLMLGFITSFICNWDFPFFPLVLNFVRRLPFKICLRAYQKSCAGGFEQFPGSSVQTHCNNLVMLLWTAKING